VVGVLIGVFAIRLGPQLPVGGNPVRPGSGFGHPHHHHASRRHAHTTMPHTTHDKRSVHRTPESVTSSNQFKDAARARTAVLHGLGHHRRPPLRYADQVGLARHEGQSPVRVRGSGVVVLVPQLVSQTARRGDRLDGEAVFEAA
jgi:hypothetical protein